MLQAENALFTMVMLLYFAAMALYFVFLAMQKEKLSKTAVSFQTAGFALHTAALVCRGIGAGRFPMTNQYEFATSFAWGLCLVSLVFIWKFHSPPWEPSPRRSSFSSSATPPCSPVTCRK